MTLNLNKRASKFASATNALADTAEAFAFLIRIKKSKKCFSSAVMPILRSVFNFFYNLKTYNQMDINELEKYNVPQIIIDKYKLLGIKHIYQWQKECLDLTLSSDSASNIIYAAPTSAGKTFVAEINIIEHILKKRHKVMYIVPFVSICHEKTQFFQQIFRGTDVNVCGFMGSQAPQMSLKRIHLAICTIEKASSMLNHLIAGNF